MDKVDLLRLIFNSISRVKKNFTISLMGKIKNGQKLKMAENFNNFLKSIK